MRQLVLFWLFWATGAGFAAADGGAPAEAPPGDFPGGQYIDSTGCVFVRPNRDWVPKLDEDGAQLCGFPPSRSAWTQGQGAATSQSKLADLERDLTISLIESEGAGINLSAPSPSAAVSIAAAPLAAGASNNPVPAATVATATVAAPVQQGIGAEIGRALRADPAIAARMTEATDPSARLCELLGMKPAATAGLPLGADPTRGYCAGLSTSVLPDPHSVLSTAKPTEEGGKLPAATAGGERGRAVAKGVATQTPPKVAKGGGASAVARTTRDAVPKASVAGGEDAEVGMASFAKVVEIERVPATARYVQIGQFNPDGVTAAIAAIRAMGYPVARQTEADADGYKVVVAGPFDTRERLIAALDRLRKAGYPHAFAR